MPPSLKEMIQIDADRSLFRLQERHEAQFIEAINTEEAWDLVTRFNDIVRTSSEPGEWEGAEYLRSRLEHHGVPHEFRGISMFLSLPRGATVQTGGHSLNGKTPSFSAVTEDGGTEGRAVLLDPVSLESLQRGTAKLPDLAGQIVVTDWPPAAEVFVQSFESLGAVGVVFVHPGARVHEDTCSPVWGSPDASTICQLPDIPVVNIDAQSGEELRQVVASNPEQELVIHTSLDTGWKEAPLVVAEIPGTAWPEEVVLLHGHLDAWHVGIGDNAVGDGAMLELARALWEHRSQLKRTVRIAWWPGHSTGRYAGSTWYADEFALDLVENCVAHLNCDSPGCRWATSFEHIPWMAELEDFTRQVILDVTGQESEGERPHRAGDWSFNNLGIPGTLMLSSSIPESVRAEKELYGVGGCGGNIEWHTEDDTLPVADRELLLRDTRVYGLAVWRLANLAVHPTNYAATLSELGRYAVDYEQAAGDYLPLGGLVDELENTQLRAERLYSTIAGRLPKLPVKTIAAFNKLQRKLARQLVHINYCAKERFVQDPATPIPPIPSLHYAAQLAWMEAGTDEFEFTRLSLKRGINRVRYALKKTNEVLGQAEELLGVTPVGGVSEGELQP